MTDTKLSPAEQTAADRDPTLAGHVPALTPDELRAQADPGVFRPDGRPAADVYLDDRLAAESRLYERQRLANQQAGAEAAVVAAQAEVDAATAKLEAARKAADEAKASREQALADQHGEDSPTTAEQEQASKATSKRSGRA